jgi:hypothetical protein
VAVVVHVANILPGQREAFTERLRLAQGRLAAVVAEHRDELAAIGIRRFVMATTPEGTSDGLLVTVFEADEPAAVERFYALEWVQAVERQNHGVFLEPHGHDGITQNVALVDARVGE